MTKTIENLLINVLELATAAFDDNASTELKLQAAAALRGLAGIIVAGKSNDPDATATVNSQAPTATATATANEPNDSAATVNSQAPTATTTAIATDPKPTPEPARPDFFSVLLEKLAPMLPEDAVADAVQAARAEGFKMPIG